MARTTKNAKNAERGLDSGMENPRRPRCRSSPSLNSPHLPGPISQGGLRKTTTQWLDQNVELVVLARACKRFGEFHVVLDAKIELHSEFSSPASVAHFARRHSLGTDQGKSIVGRRDLGVDFSGASWPGKPTGRISPAGPNPPRLMPPTPPVTQAKEFWRIARSLFSPALH